jgi:lysozyme
MTDRQHLMDDLIRDEGLRLRVYTDTVGKLTIGVGHNLTDRGISQRAAMFILNEDVEEAVTDLTESFPLFTALDVVRQRVMANMRFNLGPTRFRLFRRLIAAMAERDYVKAAGSMRRSKWYGQVGVRGTRLVNMMLTGADT